MPRRTKQEHFSLVNKLTLPEPTAAEQAAARAKEQAEQDALPYKWQQTIGDLDVTITGIPGNFKSRDLVVEIKKQSVKAGVKGQEPVISVSFTPALKEYRVTDQKH